MGLQGEFVGSFAVYGYLKDPVDKNHLIVDEYAAKVVQDIYQWKIEGLSPDKIADRLTKRGIASPMEYKKAKGIPYACVFKTGKLAKWSHMAVRRILQNEIYTGVLTQGKRTTPNYKVKKSIYKAESEWARVEGTHEAIVSRDKFGLVQQLLLEDTRMAPEGDTVYPFSGRIFCGDCEEAAVRKSVLAGGKKYAYYVCSANKADRTVCSKHSIRADVLDAAILATIQAHIKVVLDMDQALQQIEAFAWEKRELKKIEANITIQQAVIDKNLTLRMGIYEDLKEGIITKDEFLTLKEEFTERIREAEGSIKQYEQDKNSILSGFHEQQGWLAQFRQYRNISEITRKVVVNLIERINLFEGQQIEVVFKQKDQFAHYRHVTKDILTNVVYIGHLAQGRSGSCYHQGIPFHWTKPEEWDVVEHTHEPVISMELWEKVQSVNNEHLESYQRNYGKYSHLQKCSNPYGKKLVCADCGAVIKLVRSIAKGGKKAYFNFKCPTQIEHGDMGCPKKNIRQSELDEAVLQSIKKQMEIFLDVKKVLDYLTTLEQKKAKLSTNTNRTLGLQKEIKRKTSLSVNLYTDLKEGLLSEEEYRYAREKYQTETALLSQELKELQSETEKAGSRIFGERRWSGLIDTYYHVEELSAKMVDAFIEKIYLSADQSIEIRFKYLNEFEELFMECERMKKGVA